MNTASLAQLRKGVLEGCVLALLADRELYGLEIVDELQQRGPLLGASGTVYPLLARLKTKGLVTVNWRDGQAGPPRSYYAITDLGRQALTEFAQSWELMQHEVTDLLHHTKGVRS